MSVVRTGCRRTLARCEWFMDGPDLVCRLPSGRAMRYPEGRLEPGEFGGQQVTYQGEHGRRRTYGALLAENITQAVARDILAESLVRATCNAWNVVLHVHDELVFEVDEADESAQERILALCETLPSWASGLPLRAEAQSMKRYRK